jgi:hypothetical protein
VYDLGFRLGYHIEGIAGYTFYRGKTIAVSLFFSPYYQRWSIGKSQYVYLTKNGIPVTNKDGKQVIMNEPDSSTNIYGCRIGVCLTL